MIRYAAEQDKPLVRALWEQGFGKDEPYTSWYFHQVYRPERTLLYWDEKRLCSSLQLAPYQISLEGQAVPAAYVVGVVTKPDRRGRGYANDLLRRALNDLYQEGAELALLYTDIPGFYEPLGFTCCYNLRQLRFPTRRLPLAPAWEKQPPTARVLSRCQAVYRSMCSSFNGYVLRSRDNWLTYVSDWLTDARNGLYLGSDAYFLTDIGEAGFAVKELGYANATALEQALDACARLAATLGYTEFTWYAPEASPLPPQPGEARKPWVMARITGNDHLSADEAAAATRQKLGAPDPRLWVGEIT